MIYLAIFFGLIYLLMQLVIAIGWRRVQKTASPVEAVKAISVIVAARDEAINLAKNLPSILSQNYATDFEVLVVLDRCEDQSEKVILSFQKKYPNLRYISIDKKPEDWAGKKWALSRGIEAAKYEQLMFTDADCEAEMGWLRAAGVAFAEGADLVLGLGKYKKYPGLLNLFIRWETFYAGFQYIGLAGWGFPYMAVGRNFGYTKSLYQKRGGFEAFKSRLSGDDDLFVNANADAAVRCITAKGSFTYSEPERTFGDWFRQKKRHLSAATAYSFSSKMQLGIFHLSLIFHYLALLAACWDATALVVILSCYLSRLGLSVLIFYINMQNSEDKSLTTWYSVLDLLFFVFNMVIVPIGFIARPKWRRRRIENSPQKTR